MPCPMPPAKRMQRSAAAIEDHAKNARMDEAATVLHQLNDEFIEFKREADFDDQPATVM